MSNQNEWKRLNQNGAKPTLQALNPRDAIPRSQSRLSRELTPP